MLRLHSHYNTQTNYPKYLYSNFFFALFYGPATNNLFFLKNLGKQKQLHIPNII